MGAGKYGQFSLTNFTSNEGEGQSCLSLCLSFCPSLDLLGAICRKGALLYGWIMDIAAEWILPLVRVYTREDNEYRLKVSWSHSGMSDIRSVKPSVVNKLRTALGKFGEFWAHMAHFWLAWVGRNHFVNTKFSKLSKEISDPQMYNTRVIGCSVRNQSY